MVKRTAPVSRGAELDRPAPRLHATFDQLHLEYGWGSRSAIGTPAYWVDQARRHGSAITNRLGATLQEEVAACILGGYGVTAEMGLSAFRELRRRRMLGTSAPTLAWYDYEQVLRETGYRFSRQRGERVHTALRVLAAARLPRGPRDLRDWLLRLPGVGPKTASWIVRNHMDSDEVAIIDIHLHRAGLRAGFFAPGWRLPADYGRFELAFLALAKAGGVRASALDATIWSQMRQFGRLADAVLPSRPGA